MGRFQSKRQLRERGRETINFIKLNFGTQYYINFIKLNFGA
jgi:hypothetical protein